MRSGGKRIEQKSYIEVPLPGEDPRSHRVNMNSRFVLIVTHKSMQKRKDGSS